jgi:DnaJ family protein A protein 2
MSNQKKEKDDDPDHMKYYNIFGVGRNATAEEIRKAYRKLVIKLHPDKGGDPGKFEEMQNAYEVLTDPQKREVYDKYGEEGLKKGMGDTMDFDPFSFFGGFGGGHRNTRRKCKGKMVQLHVTLEEAYNGGRKEVEFPKRIICP